MLDVEKTSVFVYVIDMPWSAMDIVCVSVSPLLNSKIKGAFNQ